MILVFDCETNGLPKDYQAPLDAFDNWPRAVQIAWAAYTNSGELIDQSNLLVKPDGWIIPEEAQKKHGITLEMCQVQGWWVDTILSSLAFQIDQADYLVAHNIDFDRAVIGSEFLRAGLADHFLYKKLICTMKESTDYCAIGNGRDGRYKWPKLSELYDILFPGEKIENEHDALGDTLACARCFFELVKREVISLDVSPLFTLPDGTDIQKLAHARRILEGLQETKQAMLDTVLKDVVYLDVEKQIKEIQRLQETLESNIRETGLKQYEADHNKQPGTGWGVKVFKKVEVVKGVDLKEWCLKNFTPALFVDEKLVEKTAIAGGIPTTVVTVKDDPRVQIAKDLSEFLPIQAPEDEEELPF